MYKTYFGLSEEPFRVSTDPRFLYLTERTQEALKTLEHGIEARKGFILLTGEVGTGKTTLLNKLLEMLHEQDVATAFVFNPRMPASQLFDYILADLGIVCKSRLRSHVLFKLQQWLLDRYQAGKQTVLVVDEAQILSRQALEEIRLLTNLETSTEKLLQIVLAGQPELEQKLNQRDLRQLRQRIALRAKTLPLSEEETRGYIQERLRIAGSNGEEIFSAAAIEAIHRHSCGIPRVINLVSEQAMVRTAFGQARPVPAEIVDGVARDLSLHEVELLPGPEPVALPQAGKNGHGRKHRARARHGFKTGGERRNGHADPQSLGISQVKLPLFVYGYSADGNPFYEHAHTIAMNPRGGLISMNTPVEPGQKLLITNKENECSQECVVEFLGARLSRGVDVAFEFSTPMPEFWGARQLENRAANEGQEVCA